MQTLGESIREQRKAKDLYIREVAAELRIDPSLLSRIERGEKRPTRAQVVQLSEILESNGEKFLIQYLSGKVVSILRDETTALEAIALARLQLSGIAIQNHSPDQQAV